MRHFLTWIVLSSAIVSSVVASSTVQSNSSEDTTETEKRRKTWGGELALDEEQGKKLEAQQSAEGRGILDIFKPSPIRSTEIRYLLRDKKQPKWISLHRSGNNDRDLWYDNQPVKVIIHGFCPTKSLSSDENLENQNMFPIGNQYASLGMNYNIIVVDWTVYACEPTYKYYAAATATKVVGQDVGSFLVALKTLKWISSWDQVHIIGFSLGGQVSGVAGHTVQQLTGWKVGRITGLDPAGPLFDDNNGEIPSDVSKMLDKTDAEFVDIIHCNMGNLYVSGAGRYGTTIQSGHADFYPNGGESQKDCSFMDDRMASCSHNKCPEYFLKSIRTAFPATYCDNWDDFKQGKCSNNAQAIMGAASSTRASGRYYRFQ